LSTEENEGIGKQKKTRGTPLLLKDQQQLSHELYIENYTSLIEVLHQIAAHIAI
jgi:hypothetical protein